MINLPGLPSVSSAPYIKINFILLSIEGSLSLEESVMEHITEKIALHKITVLNLTVVQNKHCQGL